MAKSKSLKRASRKPAKKHGVANGRSQNGASKKKSTPAASLTHERLPKQAKKHRPPDEYFSGEMERPYHLRLGDSA